MQTQLKDKQQQQQSAGVDDELAFLDSLSLDELNKLSNELTLRLGQLSSVRSAQTFLAELHASNRELAESSLAKKQEIVRIKSRIEQLTAAYWETRRELEHALLKQLRALATQADVTSEERWDLFLNENGTADRGIDQTIEVERFATEYVRLRTDYHRRAAQADRLALGADTTWKSNIQVE
ncbi:hypothetical protein BDF19DRAFT_423402 [Syncephalis fuscata]|nr:hypothetical protein BDF19DRAFT_423402 [Syncephalis fuscata]